MAEDKLNQKQKKIDLNTKQKIILFSVALIILIDIALIFVILAGRKKSLVTFEASKIEKEEKMMAFNSNAYKGFIKQNGSAIFKFTQSQQKYFEKIYLENTTAALIIRLKIQASETQKDLLLTGAELPFNYGLLYESDFDRKGKLLEDINKKISVHGDLNKLYMAASNGNIDISMSIQKDEEGNAKIPCGFFVNSTLQCTIFSVCPAPALLGFDMTGEVPFYGFTCNGGIIDFGNSSVDFSSASMVFPVENTNSKAMPEIIVKLSNEEELKSTLENKIRAKVNLGGERIYIKNVKSAETLTIPTAGLKNPFALVELSENKQCITSMLMNRVPQSSVNTPSVVLTPVKTDPGLILKWNTKNWRCPDYEIFQWDRFPGIIFFDIRNYKLQDNFFRRMAYFVEKQGYKGRLLTNEELGDKHGYNAHDYSAESMAAFFIKADELNFELNKEELILKDILLENGILLADGHTVKAGNGGLVSISQESPEWQRINFLAHEGWHTIFFKDEEFRNFVAAVYYTLDSRSFDFVIDYFKSQPGLGYDTNDEYLMHNEFMAYIMQQPLDKVASYFVHLANRGSVIEYTPELAAYVRRTEGKTFEDAGIMLNDYVFDRFGILCGNIELIQR